MTDEFPSRTLDKIVIRAPDGMRERLQDAASTNGRSMNAEIVHRLETSFIAARKLDSVELKLARANVALRAAERVAERYRTQLRELEAKLRPAGEASKDHIRPRSVSGTPSNLMMIPEDFNRALADGLEKALDRAIAKKLDLRSLARLTQNDEDPDEPYDPNLGADYVPEDDWRLEHSDLEDDDPHEQLLPKAPDPTPVSTKKKKTIRLRIPPKKKP